MNKTTELDKVLMDNESLSDLYNQYSIPYSDSMLEGYDPASLHPIVLAINQIGMDLTVALDRI
jgi:hypothetical protein